MTGFNLDNTCLKKGFLDGEVAVVTGATSNVGRGYAQALAWAGAKVVVVGRNEERGAQVVADIEADCGPGQAIFVKADVSKEEDMANLKEKAYAAFGKVDILINNAMNLALNGKVLESKIEDLDESYGISARGVFFGANAFVPDMIKRGHGTVVYSTTQFMYLPPMIGGAMYTAGKSAATSLMISLANEVADTGVNVFCLCPAGVGQFNPDTMKDVHYDLSTFAMPGFKGHIPIDAAGAGLLYCIERGDEIRGCGMLMGDVLADMDYPFPVPETVNRMPRHYTDGMALTMMFCYMGHGFPDKE